MTKKGKDHIQSGNQEDATSLNMGSYFKTLFGDISEQKSSLNSLFSEANPFRRKPKETGDVGRDLGSVFEAKDMVNEPALANPDSSELKGMKRKKEGSKGGISESKAELAEEENKKLKKDALKRMENDKKQDSGLESTRQLGDGESGYFGVENGIKRKKRKRDEVEVVYEAKRYGAAEKDENVKGCVAVGEKRKKIENPEDTMIEKEGFDNESKLLRTVFVGNLPLKIKKKEIVKEFGKFGEVESVRIRSVPIMDGKTPRKGAVIQKRYNENANSVNAYVVFKSEESAKGSLALNMVIVGGNHIRVDRACPPRKKLKGDNSPLYDNNRTVFVGNLPFDVKDEEIYQLFSGISNLNSSIEGVRVIRDPGTSLGKGIAYVLFKTKDAANSVFKLRNLLLRDRKLRFSKSSSTPSKKKISTTPEAETYQPRMSIETSESGGKKVKVNENLSYQGVRASKSGTQKKVRSLPRNYTPVRSAFPAQTEDRSRKKKRPAVASKKRKALLAASRLDYQKGASKVGTKRKFGKRTPDNGGYKKKSKKL